jgi:hypothetical protein
VAKSVNTKSVALTGNVSRKFCTNENEARAPRAVCGRPLPGRGGSGQSCGVIIAPIQRTEYINRPFFSDLSNFQTRQNLRSNLFRRNLEKQMREPIILTTLKPKQSNLFNYTKSYHAHEDDGCRTTLDYPIIISFLSTKLPPHLYFGRMDCGKKMRLTLTNHQAKLTS